MSLENVLLCALVGAPIEVGQSLAAAVEDQDTAPLPLVLVLARMGRLDDLRRFLKIRTDLPVGLLASYSLFLGLTQDPWGARALLGLLREVAPLDADVWLAQARFEAAIGDEAAALRSAAVHAQLTGTAFVTPTRKDATPPEITPGAIRILRGDVDIEL